MDKRIVPGVFTRTGVTILQQESSGTLYAISSCCSSWFLWEFMSSRPENYRWSCASCGAEPSVEYRKGAQTMYELYDTGPVSLDGLRSWLSYWTGIVAEEIGVDIRW